MESSKAAMEMRMPDDPVTASGSRCSGGASDGPAGVFRRRCSAASPAASMLMLTEAIPRG